MKNILILMSAVLLFVWAFGVFIFNFPSVIHSLLIVAAVLFIRSLFVIAESEALENKQYDVARSRPWQ